MACQRGQAVVHSTIGLQKLTRGGLSLRGFTHRKERCADCELPPGQ
jgi:hypothetical protein